MIAKSVYKAHVVGVDFAWKSASLSGNTNLIYDKFMAFPSDLDRDWRVYFGELSQYCNQVRGQHCTPRLADSVIVTASSAATFHKLEDYVCDGGIIICVEAPQGGVKIETPLCTFLERQLTMKGVMMGDHVFMKSP
ncbi:hypothetical protein AUEXF2481DRAFT_444138 [Aureobasidium subglaciale EXF-2481]|uniref:Alcohol dehydrogenase-like C-terminal domain-containing protein n=1 Tax=Aureobasidium subglaciale (strain EXF-2481) TaxID=1043005 RepID=A0A074YD71_AURSE|nr:uncharacterized protein AUEXF2481DRAFT_444138 [Aureobasidium subglaciale EXF-2481]KEQ92072.1 hypothetical protein AUEXF2481DRAFT_444138 [Aureobasidium subglaciale EXF-2481]